MSLGKKMLSEAIMIPFIFKRNVLSKSLYSLPEINAGVSNSGFCHKEGCAAYHKTQCQHFQ